MATKNPALMHQNRNGHDDQRGIPSSPARPGSFLLLFLVLAGYTVATKSTLCALVKIGSI